LTEKSHHEATAAKAVCPYRELNQALMPIAPADLLSAPGVGRHVGRRRAGSAAGAGETTAVEKELKGVLQEWMILQRDFLPLPVPPGNRTPQPRK
jgi:hypothetical protein